MARNGGGALILGLLALWFISSRGKVAADPYGRDFIGFTTGGLPFVPVYNYPNAVSLTGKDAPTEQEASDADIQTKTGLGKPFHYAKEMQRTGHVSTSVQVPAGPKPIGSGKPIISKIGMDLSGTLAAASQELRQARRR